MAAQQEPAFAHDRAARLGVLLINLGTPDAPTTAAVRRYLAQFLSDPRVVEIPRVLWKPLLHTVILGVRAAAVGATLRVDLDEGRLAAACAQPAAEDAAAGISRPASEGDGPAIRSRADRTRHALRIAVDRRRHGQAETRRVRPHTGAAAVSAICGEHHRLGARRSLRAPRRRCAVCRHCASSMRITTIRATSRRWRRASMSTG